MFALACSGCGAEGPAVPLAATCEACGEPQLVRYESVASLADLPGLWAGRGRGMWRFREVLPIRDDEQPVTLGEGDTPLLELPHLGQRLGLRIMVKHEGSNPTGSFKDRGMSAAVTRAAHDGATSFVLPSAGNAGVALAAYATRAGIPATVFVPDDTPCAVLSRCDAYGIDLRRVPGVISDCGVAAAKHAAATGAFDLSTLREPYRIEGKKTMGLEILEALGWKAPDAVIYPTGGGTGLIGTWKALRESLRHGWIDRAATRLYAVQSTGCAPIVRALGSGARRATTWEAPRTMAWGLRVPGARGDAMMLAALRQSNGGALAVPDGAMVEAATEAAAEGVPLGIEGGATLAAVRPLLERGDLSEGDTVILFNTGNLDNYGWYGRGRSVAPGTGSGEDSSDNLRG